MREIKLLAFLVPIGIAIECNVETDDGRCIEMTCSDRRRFFRTGRLSSAKFENMVIFGQETYIHFVTQETMIIRKLLIFSPKQVEIKNAKSCVFYWN